MGTAEVESALVAHEAVAEAAVVGFPHEIKGQGIFAYVICGADANGAATGELVGALKEQVRHVIGPIATPDAIMIVPGLPKTRSRARSCAASCARSPPASTTAWAT